MGFGKARSPHLLNSPNIQNKKKLEDGPSKHRSGSLMIEKEHDKFWGQMVNEDTREHRMQSERKKIENKNQQKKILDSNQAASAMKKNA